MPERRNQPKSREKASEEYLENGNVEAHIIADMLRIESITAELREFKDDTKERLNKLEGWIVAIVGITITTLLATSGALILELIK